MVVIGFVCILRSIRMTTFGWVKEKTRNNLDRQAHFAWRADSMGVLTLKENLYLDV